MQVRVLDVRAALRARTDNCVIRDGAAGLPTGSNAHGGLSVDLRGLDQEGEKKEVEAVYLRACEHACVWFKYPQWLLCGVSALSCRFLFSYTI